VERVFLRIGSAETDEQLENVLGKFLAPILLKLNSADETIRKKVISVYGSTSCTTLQFHLPVNVHQSDSALVTKILFWNGVTC
jgi:hypothetical protein